MYFVGFDTEKPFSIFVTSTCVDFYELLVLAAGF